MQHPHDAEELFELAYKDELTGLHNRRYFTRVIARALEAPASKTPYCLFMMDIDFFKEINDSYGHKNGDLTLVSLAGLLKETCTGTEAPVRFAGDEFVVFLPDTELHPGLRKARDLVERARSLAVPMTGDSPPIHFTLSVGVASFPDHGTHWEEVVERADQALYAAKQGGRNRAALPLEEGEEIRRGDDLSRIFPCPEYIGPAEPLREILNTLNALPHAVNPNPLFLFCRGGHGSGKTRLLQEVTRAAEEQGVAVLRVAGTEQFQGLCFGSLIRGLIQQAGSADALRARLGGEARPDDDLWEAFFFGGRPDPEPLKPGRSHGFFQRLLQGLSGPQRTLVVLADDAEFLDPETLELFQRVQGTRDPGFRCLAVLALPPAQDPQPHAGAAGATAVLLDSLEQAAFGSLEVPPLSSEGVGGMLKAIFPTLRVHPSLLKELTFHSRGNPLYVEEALKLLIQQKVLVYRRSAWNWEADMFRGLPASLDSLLEARLDSLDPDVRVLLQKASVLGSDIDPSLLKGLGSENEGHVLDLLEKARKCGVLHGEARWQEGSLHFNADETRALSYDRIPEQDRLAWHMELARLHRSVAQGPVHLNLGALQHHYRLAGDEKRCREILDRLAPLGPATSLSLPVRFTAKNRKDAPGEPVALSQQNLAGVLSIFHLLRAAMQTWRLYPESSQAVSQACERLHEAFLETLTHTPCVRLSEAEGTLLVNGEALPWKGEEKRVAETFCRTLSAVGLKDIVFLRGLTLEAIRRFLKTWVEVQQDASVAPARWEALESSSGMEHIQVNAKVYVSVSETALFAGAGPGVEDRLEPGESLQDVSELLGSVRAALASLRQPDAGEGAGAEEAERTRALLEKIHAFLVSESSGAAAAGGGSPDPAVAREPPLPATETAPEAPARVLEKVREDDVRCALADILSGDAVREARGYRRVSEAGSGAKEALYFRLTQTDDAHEGRLCARFLVSLCPDIMSRIQGDLNRPADPAVKRRLLQYAVPVLEGPGQRKDLLSTALESEHGSVALEALHQLETAFSGEAAPVLLAVLPRCPERTRMEIYACLGRMGEHACVPQLLGALDAWKTRRDERTMRELELACDALGHFHDARIVEKLEELLVCRSRLPWRKSPPPGLRKAAVKALLRIGGDPVASILKRHESDRDPWIRLRSRQFLQEHSHA